MKEDGVARAVACLEQNDDVEFLRDVLRTIRPKVEAAVVRALKSGKDVPAPRAFDASSGVASVEEAMATVRLAKDLRDLQALARAAGQRAEHLSQPDA
jgi:hypothetical protein